MPLTLVPAGAAVAFAAACSNPSVPVVSPVGSDAQTTMVVTHDAAASGDSGNDAAPLETNLRLALFAPSTIGVDICLKAPSSQTLIGPLLYSQLPSLPDGGVPSDGAVADGALDARADGAPKPARDAAAGDATILRDSGPVHDANDDAVSDATSKPIDAQASLDAKHDAPSASDGSTEAGGRVGSGGVLPGQVSGYLSVVGAGTFTVSVVIGGKGLCTPLATLATQTVTLDPGKFSTIMVIALPPLVDGGTDASPPSSGSLVVLTDEPALTPLVARARFVNATTEITDAGRSPLQVAAIYSGQVTPLAADVPLHQASLAYPAAPPVDALGYWSGPPISNGFQLQIGSAQDAGPLAWTSVPATFDVSLGSDHTGFIVGGGVVPTSVLWCDDEESHAVLTSCVSVASQ